GYIDMAVNGTAGVDKACSYSSCRYDTYSLLGGAGELNRVDLQLTLSSATKNIPPYFNYLQMRYHSAMQTSGDELDIVLNNYSGRAEIQVTDDFTAAPTVFGLADPLQPTVVSGAERVSGLLTFQADLDIIGPNRFYCAPISEASAPTSIEAVTFTDLRSNLAQSDLIIVTPRAFVE
ncbi:MAG: hypothetical protein GY841_04210, partial [FCB group bacterium]|nr:hypothetical protein [FCB group bacterium]